jgi:hypothetical protein
MGFFVQKNRKKKNSEIISNTVIPSAILFRSNDNLNNYWVQSWECFISVDEMFNYGKSCTVCNSFWRKKLRNLTCVQTVLKSDHDKMIKMNNKERDELSTLNKKLAIDNDMIVSVKNKLINNLRKKISYWRLQCKDLRSAVQRWRKIEHERKGFFNVNDSESIKWHEFYEFIFSRIDEEHKGDPEKIALHKELIKSEISQLGKFNKSGNKRGMRTVKISSRILNYSLGLAHSLGKVKYEKEATLRSLPCWSTLTRLVMKSS